MLYCRKLNNFPDIQRFIDVEYQKVNFPDFIGFKEVQAIEKQNVRDCLESHVGFKFSDFYLKIYFFNAKRCLIGLNPHIDRMKKIAIISIIQEGGESQTKFYNCKKYGPGLEDNMRANNIYSYWDIPNHDPINLRIAYQQRIKTGDTYIINTNKLHVVDNICHQRIGISISFPELEQIQNELL